MWSTSSENWWRNKVSPQSFPGHNLWTEFQLCRAVALSKGLIVCLPQCFASGNPEGSNPWYCLHSRYPAGLQVLIIFTFRTYVSWCCVTLIDLFLRCTVRSCVTGTFVQISVCHDDYTTKEFKTCMFFSRAMYYVSLHTRGSIGLKIQQPFRSFIQQFFSRNCPIHVDQ